MKLKPAIIAISVSMKTRLLAAALAVLLPGTAAAWQGKIIDVTDGDTITAQDEHGHHVKVRLYGIDAPERNQPSGEQAAFAAVRLMLDKQADFQGYKPDRYGRTVAEVSIAGVDIQAELVRRGLAWVYPTYCTAPICASWYALEKSARASRSGLWADPQPVSPWEWRRGTK